MVFLDAEEFLRHASNVNRGRELERLRTAAAREGWLLAALCETELPGTDPEDTRSYKNASTLARELAPGEGAQQSVGQSSRPYGLRAEAAAGAVGGGFGYAGAIFARIHGELAVGAVGRQQGVGTDHEGANSRPLQPKGVQQTQGGRGEGG